MNMVYTSSVQSLFARKKREHTSGINLYMFDMKQCNSKTYFWTTKATEKKSCKINHEKESRPLAKSRFAKKNYLRQLNT